MLLTDIYSGKARMSGSSAAVKSYTLYQGDIQLKDPVP
jgi:hypothetical protein